MPCQASQRQLWPAVPAGADRGPEVGRLMRRDQFEHAIRTACQIIGHDAEVVVGSQAILGSFTDDELPAAATMSTEIDVLPLGEDGTETARLADLIGGVAGEPQYIG